MVMRGSAVGKPVASRPWRASVTARVAFLADSPRARRLTSSVTLTEPLAFLSARCTALDGLSLTVLEPAPAHLTALAASVPVFRPSRLRSLAESVNLALPLMASVQVTWTERPRLLNVATLVLAGLPTPNHALCAGVSDCALSPPPLLAAPAAAVTTISTVAEVLRPPASVAVSLAV